VYGKISLDLRRLEWRRHCRNHLTTELRGKTAICYVRDTRCFALDKSLILFREIFTLNIQQFNCANKTGFTKALFNLKCQTVSRYTPTDNFLRPKEKYGLSTRFFTKIKRTQQPIYYTAFHLNRQIKVEIRYANAFTPFYKVWLSLSTFKYTIARPYI
jgi:hypothetical protein